MVIMIIDGQGGGVGKAVIEKLKPILPEEHQLVAVGTNSIASANMMKAGAVNVATGENAVKYNAQRADIIIGSVGIISANAMFGELSPEMANAISESEAMKILIPLKRCGLYVVGVNTDSMPKMIDEAIDVAMDCIKGMKHSHNRHYHC
ncbi:MAG: DUF3842 family protein [Lachnospiraceae bacterium]|nr:DUF3842 family protein [Lachnospiraceae bacterium]